MHINLILGAIFILALCWLLREARSGKNEQKTPAAMLSDELKKRRSSKENKRRAAQRLDDLKKERMVQVLRGVNEMIASLLSAEPGRGDVSAAECGSYVILHINCAGKKENFVLTWDVKNLDLELFAGETSLADLAGFYMVCLSDGSSVREADFTAFMRLLSGLIADRLA